MTLTAAAHRLHDAGMCVVPAKADGSKSPFGPWKQYQQTCPTGDELAAWFANGTYDGLGVITGAVSGQLEMFEAEGRAVAEGAVLELGRLMTDNGFGDLWARINAGYVEVTPSGGLHWYYRIADGLANRNLKLARRPSTAAELTAWKGQQQAGVDSEPDPAKRAKRQHALDGITRGEQVPQVLIETRGEGGFSVTAPSAGRTHPQGAAWAIAAGSPETVPEITAAERDALHALTSLLDTMPAPEAPQAPSRTAGALGGPGDGVRPGDDFNARASWREILEPHGWRLTTRFGGHVLGWCRPGKDGPHVSATTGRNDGDNLYVFSSSTQFDTETPYSKFAAYALLGCGGDYAAAAAQLRREGYGAQQQPTTEDLHLLIAAPPSPPVDADEAAAEVAGPAEPEEETAPSSWRPVDLTPYLDGSYVPEEASLLPRADGSHLLYAGRVHSFHGESESGKSMLAQAEAARIIKAGGDVAYLDWESDAAAVTGRLLALGCTPDELLPHLTYVRPEGSPYALAELAAWRDLLAHPFTLAVLDGVTDALATFGTKSSSDNDEITVWMRAVPRAFAAHTGAAVVLVDHVTKDSETRGRYAVGGQAKMNGLDGSAYTIEVAEPLGRGLRGVIVMRVAKDRPGSVRPICGAFRKSDRTQEASRVVVDSTSGDRIAITFGEPNGGHQGGPDDESGVFRPTGIMERISRILELSVAPMGQNEVIDRVKAGGTKARPQTIRDATKHLIDDGFVERTETGQKHLHTSRKPYRQVNDPAADAYIPGVETLIAEPSANWVPTGSHWVPDPVAGTGSRPSSPYGDGTQSSGAESQITGSRPEDRCIGCHKPIPATTADWNRGHCYECRP